MNSATTTLQNLTSGITLNVIDHQQAVGINSNRALKKAKYSITTISSNNNFDCIPDVFFIKSLTKHGKTALSKV